MVTFTLFLAPSTADFLGMFYPDKVFVLADMTAELCATCKTCVTSLVRESVVKGMSGAEV